MANIRPISLILNEVVYENIAETVLPSVLLKKLENKVNLYLAALTNNCSRLFYQNFEKTT